MEKTCESDTGRDIGLLARNEGPLRTGRILFAKAASDCAQTLRHFFGFWNPPVLELNLVFEQL